MTKPEDPPPDPPAASETPDPGPMPEGEIGSVDELYGHKQEMEPHVHVPTEAAGPAAVVAGPVVSAVAPETLADEPLPSPVTDLREAVGAAGPRARADAKAQRAADEDEPPTQKRKRRLFTVAALSMLGLLVITTFALLGHVNAQRYVITCTNDHVSAERGRSFPPWGTQPMAGAEWKRIALPLNAECKPRETDDENKLEGWYLDLLLDRANATLNTPNVIDAIPVVTGKPPVASSKAAINPLDVVSDQLSQALLLSRSPDRQDQRKEVLRLLGDVQYWRALIRLRDASAALLDASKQFETAAQQQPRYVTDAAAWSGYTKRLADDLHAGPNGATSPQSALPEPSNHPSAPMGAAEPVEPPAAGSDVPAATPDAGVPTGGVLL